MPHLHVDRGLSAEGDAREGHLQLDPGALSFLPDGADRLEKLCPPQSVPQPVLQEGGEVAGECREQNFTLK